MKNFPYSSNQPIRLVLKKYQQLKERLRKLTQSGRFYTFSTSKQQQLVRRLNRKTFQLNKMTQGSLATGLTSIVLATVPSKSVQAQTFANEGTANPFGITMTPTQFVDFDNDGDLDFFSTNGGSGETNFFRNMGTATNPSFVQEGGANPFGLTATPHQSMVFADIDGDNDIDAFRTFNGSLDTEFLRNNAGVFTSEITGKPFGLDVPNSASSKFGILNFADIDGDGDLDAFVGSKGSTTSGFPAQLSFFRNTGSAMNPVFVKETNPATFPGAGSPIFADVDGDGDLDIFVNDGSDKFLRNTGSATNPNFVDEGNQLFGLPSVANTFADIDGDGDADAFNGTMVFRNAAITPPPTAPPVAPIPTMSQWGVMIFGLLVMNLGLFFVRSKEFLLGKK